MIRTYTSTNLPPFQGDTGGIARPKIGPTVAVCVAPADAVIKRPAGYGPGQALRVNRGVAHVAQDGLGDSYPNQEFDKFYARGDKLDPTKDPRAAFLAGFWAGQGDAGFAVEIHEAAKTRPAIVIGMVDSEAVGAVFRNHEGDVTLEAGSRILQSPDDETVRWAVGPAAFEKKYQGVERG